MKQAHAAGAEDDRGAAGLDPRSMDGTEDASRRFHEYRRFVRQMIRQAVRRQGRRPRPHQDLVCEAAGFEKIFAKGLAHGLVAAPAEGAVAAGDVMGHRHPVAFPKSVDAGAEGNHVTDKFVAEDGARVGAAGIELEQIGAAESDDPEIEQHLARRRRRDGSRFERRFIAAPTGDDAVGLAVAGGHALSPSGGGGGGVRNGSMRRRLLGSPKTWSGRASVGPPGRRGRGAKRPRLVRRSYMTSAPVMPTLRLKRVGMRTM